MTDFPLSLFEATTMRGAGSGAAALGDCLSGYDFLIGFLGGD
jgi:hypothetical protein